MKWFSISGSWRVTNKKLEKDVEQRVKKIILKGNGISTTNQKQITLYRKKATSIYEFYPKF